MRKLTTGLILFVIAAGVAISAYWFIQASRHKRNIEEAIASFNTGPVQITYTALETSGFPLDMIVSMQNPRMVGRMDLLLNSGLAPNQTPLPEWQQDLTLEGTLQLRVNAMSNHYGFSKIGRWKNHSIIGGQTMEFVSQPDSNLQCTLDITLAGLSKPWNFAAIGTQNERKLQSFRLFDCAATEDAITDPKTNKVLLKSGPQRIYISNDPVGEKRQVRVYANIGDFNVTPEGDKMIEAYSRIISPKGNSILLSAYGKQNLAVEFSYIGPLDWQGSPKGIPLDIHLSKFDMSSDASTFSATADLTSGGTPQNYTARLAFKAESTFSELYSLLLQDIVRDTVQQMFLDQEKPKEFAQTLEQYTPETFYTLIVPAIPDFHALGKLVTAVDLSYQGNQEFTAGDLKLSTLEFSATPYGIVGSGAAKRVINNPIPSATVTFICTNCLHMVDDIASYMARLNTILVALEKDKVPLPSLDSRTVEGYKSFLQALATDASTPNLTYVIVSNGSGSFTINNKPMNEIMMLYHKHVPMQHTDGQN